jgi:hypothetical protein
MSKYTNLTEPLSEFVKAKSDWDDEMFLYPANSILSHVRNSILDCPDCERLLIAGSADDMEELREAVAKGALKMLPITLQNILFFLYDRSRKQEEYSMNAVRWFRSQGWNFAPFPFEIEEQTTQKTGSDTDTDASLNPADDTSTVKVVNIK